MKFFLDQPMFDIIFQLDNLKLDEKFTNNTFKKNLKCLKRMKIHLFKHSRKSVAPKKQIPKTTIIGFCGI